MGRQERRAGRNGGSARSRRKTEAVRKNGAKGGRPKGLALLQRMAREIGASIEDDGNRHSYVLNSPPGGWHDGGKTSSVSYKTGTKSERESAIAVLTGILKRKKLRK